VEAQQYQDDRSQADANEKDKQTDEPWSSPQLHGVHREAVCDIPSMSQPFHGRASIDPNAAPARLLISRLFIACLGAGKHGRF
jgi:hypothetical protein